MKQWEIAKYYGIPTCDVSVATINTGSKPTDGWNLLNAGEALIQYYCDKGAYYRSKAREWEAKANRIAHLRSEADL